MAVDQPVYSILEWCAEGRISPSFYYKQQKAGLGPRLSHMGRRTVVTESPSDYFKRVTQQDAAAREAM